MFSENELKILYAALVNYSTAELREKLREGGEHGLAESISPLGVAFLAMKVEHVSKEAN